MQMDTNWPFGWYDVPCPCFHKQDILARVGGEEFAILLVGVELEVISPVNGSASGLT